MKTFETSTNILPLINVGHYWGPFEDFWLCDEEDERREGNFVCDDYDFEKFKEAIVEEANKILEKAELFKAYGVASIKATSMGSPKEYNFGDDWLNLEVTVEDDFLDRAEKAIFDPKYHDLLDEFARREWSSRDGFSSSMRAWNLDEMHEVFDHIRKGTSGIDDMRDFGSVLCLLREIEIHEKRMEREDDAREGNLTWELVGNVRYKHSFSDFVTILSREEVQKRYPLVAIMDKFDAADAMLDESMKKYAASSVSQEAIDKTRKEVDRRHDKIDDYRSYIRSDVELRYPDDEAVNAALKKHIAKWEAEFGDVPTRKELGNPDLPGQETLL